jgi:Transposase IS116/IS110/IS902 family
MSSWLAFLRICDIRRAARFLGKEASPELLIGAAKRTWQKFPYTHRLAYLKTFNKRLAIFSKADHFLVPSEISRAKSRQVLTLIGRCGPWKSQLDAHRDEIERLFAQHSGCELYRSLPGVGKKLGLRLLGKIGSDRSIFPARKPCDAWQEPHPLSYQSGQIHKVCLRRHCNKFLRHTVHLWADLSRDRSPWAQTYYQQQRTRG